MFIVSDNDAHSIYKLVHLSAKFTQYEVCAVAVTAGDNLW